MNLLDSMIKGNSGSNMKKIVIKNALLLFLVAVVIVSGYSMVFSRNKICIVADESTFSDFYIENNVVGVHCIVTLYNSYSSDMKVGLTAFMQKDVESGLLKEARLPGINRDDSLSYFILKANSTSTFHVVFTGKYNGNNQKADRMLPEIVIETHSEWTGRE